MGNWFSVLQYIIEVIVQNLSPSLCLIFLPPYCIFTICALLFSPYPLILWYCISPKLSYTKTPKFPRYHDAVCKNQGTKERKKERKKVPHIYHARAYITNLDLRVIKPSRRVIKYYVPLSNNFTNAALSSLILAALSSSILQAFGNRALGLFNLAV